ncbi:MAG: hypothetical protein JNM56_10880 [Planctomycetia bacterium]|nr:hypothetical protein [Planctomycetia bacterium]
MEALGAAVVVLYGIMLLIGLVGLVCFVMVVVKMFQHDQTGLGIACIVLGLCTGIGGIIAFVVGWMNASQWGIQGVMKAWTAVIVVQLLLVCGIVGLGAAVGTMGTSSSMTFQTVGQSIGTRP